MTELPAEVREKAARAAQNRVGRVAYEYWTEVVDAVSEVLAEHPGATSAAGSARWVRVASLVDKEGFPTEAVIDAVADLVDERDDLRAEYTKLRHELEDVHGKAWNANLLLERKLAKQRKRRKAAGAKVAELKRERRVLREELVELKPMPFYEEGEGRPLLWAQHVFEAEQAWERMTLNERDHWVENFEDGRRSYIAAKLNASVRMVTSVLREERNEAEAERDALQARVENLRAALERVASEDICEVYTPATGWTDCRDAKEREAWCPACVNRDALAADDRAAGRTEEEK